MSTLRIARALPWAVLLAILTSPLLPGQVAWTDVSPAAGNPPPRYHHAMTFDRDRDVAVVFGGVRPGVGIVADTWEWSAGTWTQRLPATAPPATYGCLLAYDRVRQHGLLFGGWNGSSYIDQTWVWNGTTWTRQLPQTSPPGRYFPGVVYDPSTGTVLMFGGFDGTSHRNDTWRWDGATWVQLVADSQPGSPPGRRGPGIAWDEHRHVAVMFGGFVQFSPMAIAFDDTWEWNGGWVQRSPATVPPARAHCGMAFDAFRGRTVMHGGDQQGAYLTDTWEWNGVDWAQRNTAAMPPNSTGQGFVYDPGTRRILMYGGFDGTNTSGETWSYATTQPASFTVSGVGCGPGFMPGLAVDEPDLPWVGESCTVQVTQVPAGRLALLFAGFSDVTSAFGPLPVALGAVGAPGCTLYIDPLVSFFAGVTPAAWSTGVLPASAVGASLYVQAAVLEPGANALGIVVSPGGRLVLGAR